MASNTTLQSIFALRMASASGSSETIRALTRIGMLLRSEMILNLTRMRAVDTGNLRNSIRYEINETTDATELSVGSYGVPYARVIEYGFSGPQTVRAHFREIRQAFGKQLDEPRTVRIRSHTRMILEGSRPARPFMRNALLSQQDKILQILKEELGVE